MSIDSILEVAVSALNASQAALRTTASNIANVNTPGYARQVVELETQVTDGSTTGVKVAEIRRIVDQFLIAEVRKALSDAEANDVQAILHDRIQALLGGPDDDSTLGAQLNRVFTSLAELTIDPGSAARRLSALADLKAFGDDIARLAQQVQDLRAEADRLLSSDITKVNDSLTRIHKLNLNITREVLAGRDANALIEQRAQAVAAIAKVIDIRVRDLNDGAIAISTVSGLTLLDNVARTLVYAGPGTVTSATRFPEITVNKVDPVTGIIDPTGIVLDHSIESGSLRGYLNMRNTQLPDLAAQLGELAAKFVDQLNSVHNDATAVPPPNSLTGRATGLTLTDNHGFTGKVTLAVIDATNQISNSFVVDFSAYTTINEVITAANAALAGDATLVLSNGVLTFAAINGADGVSLLQDAATPSDRGGRGFAHFFGLNDLMEAKVPPHYDTGFTGTDAHRFNGITTLALRGADGQEPVTYTLDFSVMGGATFDDIVNDLNANMGSFVQFSLDANGKLVTTPASTFAGYKIVALTDTTDRAGAGITLTRLFGLGERYRSDAAFDVRMKSVIKANNDLLALAKLDTTAGAGMPALTVGDARGALEFEALVRTSVSFATAGDVSGTATTFGEYATLVVSQVSINAENMDRLNGDSQALKRALEDRLGSVSGVNLDEELINMVIFQNAYNASARLISLADEMFDTLLSVLN